MSEFKPKLCRCPKCGSDQAISRLRIATAFQGNHIDYLDIEVEIKPGKGFLNWGGVPEYTTITYLATVCTDCGYVEFVADGNLKALLKLVG